MIYKLSFHPQALKEWGKLDGSIQAQFKKKLQQRLENPLVKKDKLRGYAQVYKIKLRTAGYRLAYQVLEDEIRIFVIVIGRRDAGKIYNMLKKRHNI
ncbi:MAG: type II toxin-antitoxin system RelE/ParE family toxin [Candidatus Thioglobus sp.]|nr:type II toxin-antitoxin system RelE/ParE family toxin [Candidatus Thioglobus sp.]